MSFCSAIENYLNDVYSSKNSFLSSFAFKSHVLILVSRLCDDKSIRIDFVGTYFYVILLEENNHTREMTLTHREALLE